MKRIVNPKLCMSCKLRCCCIGSPVCRVKASLGIPFRPILPFPGPTKDGCMSYIKEENNERI